MGCLPSRREFGERGRRRGVLEFPLFLLQEGRSGRWSAPSRVRRVSLEQSPAGGTAEPHPPPPDRRDSRVECVCVLQSHSLPALVGKVLKTFLAFVALCSAYMHSNSSSCMTEIAELSESRRESAAETAEEDTRPDR